MKRYHITLLTCNGELDKYFETDSAKTALNRWFRYNYERPLMANISCGSKRDALSLYQVFLDNGEEFYSKYWLEGNFSYGYAYICDACQRNYTSKNFTFRGNSEFYDSVYPFCYG